MDVILLIHAGIKVNLCCQKGPQLDLIQWERWNSYIMRQLMQLMPRHKLQIILNAW